LRANAGIVSSGAEVDADEAVKAGAGICAGDGFGAAIVIGSGACAAADGGVVVTLTGGCDGVGVGARVEA
jgi:hypothetical protein